MSLSSYLDGVVTRAPQPFSTIVWICIIVVTGCALVTFIAALLAVSNAFARRCTAARFPCCGAYRLSEDSEERAAMAASFVSTPRSVKRIVSCGMRLARPPVLLAWLCAGIIATAPLLVIEFFDWTFRAFGVAQFSDVNASFRASPSLVLLLWFELACIALWTFFTLVEVVIVAVLTIQHLRVLSLFRHAYVSDAHRATVEGEAAVEREQATREERFQAAAISRAHGYSVAVIWILRTAAASASFFFAGLQVHAPAENARLVHTVMVAVGAIGVAQIM
jgi:hypothetical protein